MEEILKLHVIAEPQLGRWSIGLRKITLLWIPHCLVSDQGTCKNKRVKQKDQSAFGWMTEISGDLHTKGHLCETTFQAQGKGGFHHLITKLYIVKSLLRIHSEKDISRTESGTNQGGCERCINGVWYGCCLNFKMSKYFPTKESLKKHLQRQGTHDKILVEHFYTCLKECSDEDDANFAYHT